MPLAVFVPGKLQGALRLLADQRLLLLQIVCTHLRRVAVEIPVLLEDDEQGKEHRETEQDDDGQEIDPLEADRMPPSA